MKPKTTGLLSALLVAALCLSCARRAPAMPAPDAPRPDAAARATDGTSLDLRISPLVDLWYYIRAEAAEADAETSPGYEAAVDAARAIQRHG